MRTSTAVRCGLGVIAAAVVVAAAAAGVLLASGDTPAQGEVAQATTTTAPQPATAVDAPGSHVLVVGDSLTNSSTEQVRAALVAEGLEPVVQAIGSTDIQFWAGRMGELVSIAEPDVVVVELGTNNCDITCDGVTAAIQQLLNAVPSTTPIYWLNVQEQPFYPRDAAYVNDLLRAAAAADSRVTIVDMDSLFRDHPEWHIPDGLHFTPEGSEQLAGLITEALTTPQLVP